MSSRSPLSVRAICFDIGDTLVFDFPNRAERIENALIASGIEVHADVLKAGLKELEERGLKEYLQGKAPDDPEAAFHLTARLLFKLGILASDAITIRILGHFLNSPFQRVLLPGCEDILEELKHRGFKLGVVSDWESSLPLVLDELGILKYFDTLSISEDVGAIKPEPALFRDAIHKLGYEPDEILHVGDYAELDVAGARSVGMHALLFDRNHRHEDTSLDITAVRTFDELKSYLYALKLPQ